MATISLSTVWLNAKTADDTWADHLGLKYVQSFSVKRARQVVDQVAGGGSTVRFRTFDLGAQSAEVTLSGWMDEGERAWLADHLGQLLCLRDPRGGKLFGRLAELPADFLTYTADLSAVSLSFREVTHGEAV